MNTTANTADNPRAAGEDIGPDDIVFECPACGKSMVINQRGAGLLINCVACGVDVQVPPADAGAASDDTLPDVSTVLADCRERIAALEAELEDVRGRRRVLERRQLRAAQGIEQLKSQLAVLRAALAQMDSILKGMEAPSGDTQPIA